MKRVQGGVGLGPRPISLGLKCSFQLCMYYVYVLYSRKLKKRYVGFTSDLRNRLTEHNGSGKGFTSGGKPWKLIYYQAFISKKDAIEEELFLKSDKGRQRLDICLKETMAEML